MTAPPRWSERRVWRWGRWVALAIALIALGAVVRLSHRSRHESASCTSSCHSTETHPPSWRLGAGHDSVACQGCHQSGPGSSLRLLLTSVTGAKPPKHGAVDESSCSRCHEADKERWQRVAETAGHREHASGARGVSCLSCHTKSTHGSEGAEQACKNCHKDERLHHGVADSETCTSCHNFSLGEAGEARVTAVECSRCHADPKRVDAKSVVTTEMLHGSVDCKLCHQPHRALPREPAIIQVSTIVAAGPDALPDAGTPLVAGGEVCRSCHQIQIGLKGEQVPEGHTNCVKCHAPHASLDQFVVPCKQCHEQGRESASGAKSTALHHDSCASCHVPHTWHAARSGCVQCHDQKATLVQAKSPPAHQQCQSCHEPHEPLPGGSACVNCHKTRANHLASAPAKHKNCASCHDPHAANVMPKGACVGCHTQQNRQLVQDGPQKHEQLGCLGCHQPHNSPKPKATLCASCHQQNGLAVAKAEPEPHRRCISCHKPHRFELTSSVAACRGCHQQIARSPGPHDAACTKCHSQHGSPSVTRAACNGCHQEIQLKPPPGNTQHADCSSCHQPHLSAASAPARCASCHSDKAQIATRWPASSAHAKQCNTCHQPHDVRDVKSCASCHAKQASSAKGGKHRCQQCHAPHAAPPGTGAAWWQRCASCHQSETQQAKAGKAHADCNKCHQPHRFDAPRCTSCHQQEVSKAGHTVKGHQNCNACHTTHLASMPERAQCLRCHTAQTQHQPSAQRCQACHPFK